MSLFLIKIFVIFTVLISIAFITLLERKILGYVQIRKGPNKIGFLGILQPVADAIKLFSKGEIKNFNINMLIFNIIPLISLILILIYWLIVEIRSINRGYEVEYVLVFLLVISSLSVYVVIFRGWASNSKYAILGSYRGVAQIISYEVSLSFLIFRIFIIGGSLKLYEIKKIQVEGNIFILSLFIIFIYWMVIMLAETNRTPFDLTEGESELVSGFNVEYGGFNFAVLFIAEYGNIFFISWLTRLMFFKISLVIVLFILFLVLVVRGTLIRYRYDKLIILSWQKILPFIILNFVLISTIIIV